MKKNFLLSVLSLFVFWTPLLITKQATTNKNELFLTGEKIKTTPKENWEEMQKLVGTFITVHTEIKENIRDLIGKINTAYKDAIIPYKKQGFAIKDVIYRVSIVNDLIKFILNKRLFFINLLQLNDFYLPHSIKVRKQNVTQTFIKFRENYSTFVNKFILANESNTEEEWKSLEGSFFVNILFFKEEINHIEKINNDFLDRFKDILKNLNLKQNTTNSYWKYH